jgi:hypothetical protein
LDLNKMKREKKKKKKKKTSFSFVGTWGRHSRLA